MARFCTQCGSSISEAARFCNKCGAKLAPTQPASQPQSQPAANPSITYQAPQGESNYGQGPYQQPPYQAPYPQPSAAANADLKPNIAALLCYPLSFVTGILFLVLTPYNKDPLVRFHAYQSIFFFVAMLALNIVLGIFSIVTPWFIDNLIYLGLRLLALGGTGWLMYQAYQGQKFKFPVIGDLAETQASKP
ncbi:MAG TPA: zinc-ribbon domain-containing protein [Blastocatellia bacterium]|nr:zinc-ribbon domain-containing protein [Blastocatellia bacterium]